MLEFTYTVGGVLIGTAIWLWVLRSYDRVEPEAIRHLILVGLIGGFASIAVALFLNEVARVGLGVDAAIFYDATRIPVFRLAVFCLAVGVIEETSKAVSAVHTTRRLGDLNEPVDAMVYAMTVALGFASFENVFYALRFGNDVLVARFLWPVPAHMAYAALWGYGLAWARYVHPDKPYILTMAPSVMMAAAFHAGANFLLFLQQTATGIMSLLALAALAMVAHVRLRRLVAESPFLEPGECVSCRYVNEPHAMVCANCGIDLEETQIFVTCPCEQTRIADRHTTCPHCGVPAGPGAIHPASAERGRLPASHL